MFFFAKEYVTILIAFSSLSELSGNSIFMHRRGRATYDQISAVRVNGNKHAYQLQTGLRHAATWKWSDVLNNVLGLGVSFKQFLA